jgi:hypothetical protein
MCSACLYFKMLNWCFWLESKIQQTAPKDKLRFHLAVGGSTENTWIWFILYEARLLRDSRCFCFYEKERSCELHWKLSRDTIHEELMGTRHTSLVIYGIIQSESKGVMINSLRSCASHNMHAHPLSFFLTMKNLSLYKRILENSAIFNIIYTYVRTSSHMNSS